MTIYRFKEGSHLSGDAQAVGERLARLEENGKLTPEGVLRDAKKASSALHQLFEWDDARAAHLHRLAQAGHIIRCITVEIEARESEPTRTIRAFVPIEDEHEDRTYVTTMRALSDDVMRRQVLSQAHAELGAVAKKYRELKELAEVVQAIERVGELLHFSEGQPS